MTITTKNVGSKAAQELSLNEVVYQLASKTEITNDKLFAVLKKAGRKFSEKSVRWYASKARAGVRR